MSAKVLAFVPATQSTGDVAHRESSPRFAYSGEIGGLSAEARSGKYLDTKSLYNEQHTDDSQLFPALDFIFKSIEALKNARELSGVGDYLALDSCLMKSNLYLSKALKYESLGNGYTAVINASVWALSNTKDSPLDRKQISTLADVLEKVTQGPFMHFDSAMNLVDILEDADMNVDPPALDTLLPTFNE